MAALTSPGGLWPQCIMSALCSLQLCDGQPGFLQLPAAALAATASRGVRQHFTSWVIGRATLMPNMSSGPSEPKVS